MPAPYPPPAYPLGPSQIPPDMRDIVTNNPGGFPHPPLDWDGPRPEVWRMEMSYIEAAALHDLPVRYPEAYEWLIAEARKRVRPGWQGRQP